MFKPCSAFCSTSRIPTPASRTRASAWNNSPHISGDRPSEGSSSSSSFGADISARPIATICCSPPLMVRASCAPRSASRGNSVLHAREIVGLVGAGAARDRRRARDFRARSARRRCRALREPARRRPRRSRAAAAPAGRGPSKVTRVPGCGRTSPAIALSRVDLPAPFAPSITTISPGLTSRSTPASARCLP